MAAIATSWVPRPPVGSPLGWRGDVTSAAIRLLLEHLRADGRKPGHSDAAVNAVSAGSRTLAQQLWVAPGCFCRTPRTSIRLITRTCCSVIVMAVQMVMLPASRS